MVLDLDRLFHTLDVIEIDGRLHLTVDISGVSTLEQIVFNKRMLNNVVYCHHKVRAAECLFKSLIENIKTKRDCFPLESAADFLYLTDDDIYGLLNTNKGLISKLTKDILYRNLPKRALVLSRKTLENPKDLVKISTLPPDVICEILKEISEETKRMGQYVPPEDIWLDMPPGLRMDEGIGWPVKSVGESKGFITLRDLFPVDDWAKAFQENKWKGHIFTRPEYVNVVFKAAKTVLEGCFDLKLNKFAKILCKMDEDNIPNDA